MDNIKVYIEIDSRNIITKIFSNVFETPTESSILIDEGNGDKYAHAQNIYLEKGLVDSNFKYNYKYNNGAVSLTEEEKVILFPKPASEPTETELTQQAITDLELTTIEQGQQITALELLVLEGTKNV